jgi:hypothetical protein
MKYFSEDSGYINAECEHCNRVLKIKKVTLTRSSNGYLINNPSGIKCVCGAVHNNILGSKKKPPFKYISQKENQNKNGESDKTVLKQIGVIALLAIGIPTIVIGSCVRSCKNEFNRVNSLPKRTDSEIRMDNIKTELKNTQFEPGMQKYVDEMLEDE